MKSGCCRGCRIQHIQYLGIRGTIVISDGSRFLLSIYNDGFLRFCQRDRVLFSRRRVFIIHDGAFVALALMVSCDKMLGNFRRCVVIVAFAFGFWGECFGFRFGDVERWTLRDGVVKVLLVVVLFM